MNTIKYYRERNNMTQEELAEKLGLTQRMISYYENGKKIPSGKTLLRFKKLFNVTADELLSNYTLETPKRLDKQT